MRGPDTVPGVGARQRNGIANETMCDVKILIAALIFAAIWTMSLAAIAQTYGLHSGPGIWAGTLGLPGVVAANLLQTDVLHSYDRATAYAIMFAVNWVFYCSVLQGIVSLKRAVWN